MPTQSELFPSEGSQTPEVVAASSAAAVRVRAATAPISSDASAAMAHNATQRPQSGRQAMLAPLWLQRISLAVLVTFCIYIGLLLLCLPWTRFWDQNPLLLAYPPLARVWLQGATRGVVSGLGLLDLWIGCAEVLHFTPRRRPQNFAKIPIRTMQKP